MPWSDGLKAFDERLGWLEDNTLKTQLFKTNLHINRNVVIQGECDSSSSSWLSSSIESCN